MFLMAARDIVFDLDGTLIDSAPSILASMQAAFDGVGLVPCAALTPALIGPPLVQTLRALLPEGAVEQALPALVEGFKRHYDAIGYQQTTVYPGVQDMLQALVHMPLRLHIATNKRIAPTRRIVEHLGWGGVFTSVHALDAYAPALVHKAAMLQHLRYVLTDPVPLYVGDRAEDAEAAHASGMAFLWASWGYGGCDAPVLPANVLRVPLQLAQVVHNPLGQSAMATP